MESCCDGINSLVAKWLGFKKPVSTGSWAIRGYANFENGHSFCPKARQFIGHGLRLGLVPCNQRIAYWFLTWKSSNQEKTPVDGVSLSPLRTRWPWELLWGNISKGNVCVAGDALHPMTPYIGQGGCSAMEDGVVLARCLAEALRKPHGDNEEEEYRRIEMGLKKYAKERRWRSFDLTTTAYMVGAIQENNGKLMSFIRDKFLSRFLAGLAAKKADFDCGKLSINS
ncbi:hypothetical protein PTKIN_Ptkin02bG0216600 [Pterospermum kingtungense]